METTTPSRGESNRGSQNSELSTRGKDGRRKSALRRQKNCSAPEARLNARAGTSLSIALLLPYLLLPVPGGNLSKLERNFSERLWCVAVSFLKTTAPGSADLAQNSVRKGRPVQGARNREFVRDAITYRHVIRPSSCAMIPRRTLAGALDAHPSWAGRLTCSVIVTPSCIAFLGRRLRA